MGHLILTRRKGQSINITVDGREVIVTVVAIKGEQIRLGFTAPREIAVVRSELIVEAQPGV